jgi:hypothetical protein
MDYKEEYATTDYKNNTYRVKSTVESAFLRATATMGIVLGIKYVTDTFIFPFNMNALTFLMVVVFTSSFLSNYWVV